MYHRTSSKEVHHNFQLWCYSTTISIKEQKKEISKELLGSSQCQIQESYERLQCKTKCWCTLECLILQRAWCYLTWRWKRYVYIKQGWCSRFPPGYNIYSQAAPYCCRQCKSRCYNMHWLCKQVLFDSSDHLVSCARNYHLTTVSSRYC